jgi:hypothetical protein
MVENEGRKEEVRTNKVEMEKSEEPKKKKQTKVREEEE